MRVFWRKGYAPTSIEDLVEALHLSRSSLYDTFGDKRALFLEALRLYSRGVISRIERTLKEASSPKAAVQALLDDLAASAGSQAGAMGCFMVNSVAELVPYDADVTQIAATYSSTIQGLLTATLKQGAAEDDPLRPQTPEQLAAYVFNTMQGIRILIKAGASRAQIESIGAITLKSLD